MHLDYELIDGSYDEVEVTVTDIDKRTVLYASMAPSARRDWTLESDGGEEEERNFQVCFDNTVYMERKLVSFSWHLNQDELLKYAKADQIENSLKKKVDTLWEEIDTVKDMVHYFGLVQSQQHQSTFFFFSTLFMMDALTFCKNVISKSEHEFKSGLVFWTRSGIHCNYDGDANICIEEFFREASACLIRVNNISI